MALNCYLFHPGGQQDGIPTKTPCCQIQLSSRLSSSFRTLLQVWSTNCYVTAFLPCSLLLVDNVSKCKWQFICATHLLWISAGGWNFSGFPSDLMTFSQRSFHMRCTDSVMRISNRRFFPQCFFPLSVLKSTNPDPKIVPKCIVGQDVSCFSHKHSASFHMALIAGESGHSIVICSIDSDSPQ